LSVYGLGTDVVYAESVEHASRLLDAENTLSVPRHDRVEGNGTRASVPARAGGAYRTGGPVVKDISCNRIN
jgi:hypothetical protein